MKKYIHPYKLKNGETLWKVRYHYRDPQSGKRKDGYKAGFKRKKDAEAYLHEQKHKIATNSYIVPRKITVEEYMEEWLSRYVEKQLKPTTVNSYTSRIRTHIIPHLGSYKLQELKPMHISNLYSTLLEGGRATATKDGNTRLSVRSVRQVKANLNSAFKDAVLNGYISKNPAQGVPIPSKDSLEPGSKENYLTREQLKNLLILTQDNELHLPIMLAALTSLRRGEVLGLAWEDIDFDEGKITIQRTLNIDRNRAVYYGTPKTDASARSIYLPGILLNELKKLRLKQKVNNLQSINPVFTNASGELYNPDSFSRAFTDLIKRLGMPKITFHGLQHTYATLMLESGAHNINDISKFMGHAQVSVTLDFYGHVTEDQKKKMAQTMGNIIDF